MKYTEMDILMDDGFVKIKITYQQQQIFHLYVTLKLRVLIICNTEIPIKRNWSLINN